MASSAQVAGFQLASPLVLTDRLLFESELTVSVQLGLPGVSIHSTYGGSTPTPDSPTYAGPLTISESGTLKVRAFHPAWRPSDVVEREFLRVRHRVRNVELASPPSPEYPGRGASTLMALEGGGSDFRDGSWLGFREHDLRAVLDLGTPVAVGDIVVSCLVDNASWIFHPSGVNVATSGDGVTYAVASSEVYAAPTEPEREGQHFLRVAVGRRAVRFLRVTVEPRAALPDWHPGAGGQPWLFVDAIAVV